MDFLQMYGDSSNPASLVRSAAPGHAAVAASDYGIKGKTDWVQTYTGKAVYPEPGPDDEFDIVDIAHHLAIEPRFQGATSRPYSVAEHLVRCMRLVPFGRPKVRKAVLLHDAAEYVFRDLARPIKMKPELAHYRAMHDAFQSRLNDYFGVEPGHEDEIHRVDEIMLATEKRDLMAPSPMPWCPLPTPSDERIVPWSWDLAKHIFLESFYELAERLAEPAAWGD